MNLLLKNGSKFFALITFFLMVYTNSFAEPSSDLEHPMTPLLLANPNSKGYYDNIFYSMLIYRNSHSSKKLTLYLDQDSIKKNFWSKKAPYKSGSILYHAVHLYTLNPNQNIENVIKLLVQNGADCFKVPSGKIMSPIDYALDDDQFELASSIFKLLNDNQTEKIEAVINKALKRSIQNKDKDKQFQIFTHFYKYLFKEIRKFKQDFYLYSLRPNLPTPRTVILNALISSDAVPYELIENYSDIQSIDYFLEILDAPGFNFVGEQNDVYKFNQERSKNTEIIKKLFDKAKNQNDLNSQIYIFKNFFNSVGDFFKTRGSDLYLFALANPEHPDSSFIFNRLVELRVDPTIATQNSQIPLESRVPLDVIFRNHDVLHFTKIFGTNDFISSDTLIHYQDRFSNRLMELINANKSEEVIKELVFITSRAGKHLLVPSPQLYDVVINYPKNKLNENLVSRVKHTLEYQFIHAENKSALFLAYFHSVLDHGSSNLILEVLSFGLKNKIFGTSLMRAYEMIYHTSQIRRDIDLIRETLILLRPYIQVDTSHLEADKNLLNIGKGDDWDFPEIQGKLLAVFDKIDFTQLQITGHFDLLNIIETNDRERIRKSIELATFPSTQNRPDLKKLDILYLKRELQYIARNLPYVKQETQAKVLAALGRGLACRFGTVGTMIMTANMLRYHNVDYTFKDVPARIIFTLTTMRSDIFNDIAMAEDRENQHILAYLYHNFGKAFGLPETFSFEDGFGYLNYIPEKFKNISLGDLVKGKYDFEAITKRLLSNINVKAHKTMAGNIVVDDFYDWMTKKKMPTAIMYDPETSLMNEMGIQILLADSEIKVINYQE